MNTILYEKLRHLQWLLKKQHRQKYSQSKPMADASRGQGRILAFLKMKDGISTKDLSYLLGMHISSLNEFIAKLEKSGYVTRKPSEDDKRVMLTYLTEKGKQDQEEPEVAENDVFASFTEEEQNAFGEYLDRIISLLEEEVGTEDENGDKLAWMESAEKHMGQEHFRKFMKMQGRMSGCPHHKHSDRKSSDSSRDHNDRKRGSRDNKKHRDHDNKKHRDHDNKKHRDHDNKKHGNHDERKNSHKQEQSIKDTPNE